MTTDAAATTGISTWQDPAWRAGALEQHGAVRGSWLTLRRLVRCRPGAAGGPDPVPAAA